MMFSELIPLQIFPPGSLSSSIITTVWIGIFVVAFFNLRFGWVLSGLVVPGYVVPLLILNPWSAIVIIAEAIVTYLIVWFVSEFLSRWGPWCNFFGRDRFLALVLTSVLVRVVFDGWLLPLIGEFFIHRYGLAFDYQNQLHSFGLIIVALIANQFWKSGLVRGFIPLLTSLAITYLIVRFGLMELTNFTISNLSYMYDDLAVSMLSAPKAYIILITTAFIASRMNLIYSWDFNGILIPALLALQWYQPYKILTSFAEAFIILLIAHLVLATPLFKSMTIEGARKLLLFFNIGFIYKIALGYFLLWYMPTVKFTDYYAFGYLLSTLIAVKMHDKQIALRMTRTIVQISLVGVLIASIFGFSMKLMSKWLNPPPPTNTFPIPHVNLLPQTEFMELISLDKIHLYKGRIPNSYIEPRVQEIDAFQNGLEKLLAYQQYQEEMLLKQAALYFAQVKYQTLLIQERYIYLREIPPVRGWGIYLLDLKADNPLLIEIPAPLDEAGIFEVGTILFRRMQGYALAIAGSAREANRNGASDMLTNTQSFFQTFHRTLAYQDVLQVRAYTPRILPVLRETFPTRFQKNASSLWVKRALPSGLDLALLEQLIDHYLIEWTTAPFPNIQQAFTEKGFTELFLSQNDVTKLLLSEVDPSAFSLTVSEQGIEDALPQWISSDKIAAKNSNLYIPPTAEELLFFDLELLTPLLRVIQTEYKAASSWSQQGLKQLQLLASVATNMGYRLMRYQISNTQQEYLILEEQNQSRRYWGTYVFRLETSQNYILQVPRPIYDANSFEYAITLFERLQAKVLLIGGTHPAANLDGSSDLVRHSNVKSLFNLMNQVVMREMKYEPMLVIQTRTFSRDENAKSSPKADILLAFDKGLASQRSLNPLGKRLFQLLTHDGLNIQFVSGEASTAGYEVNDLPQALYLDATLNKELAILWLSPTIKELKLPGF
ncbi:membrane protein [Beggiatoa sp. PS]|nr:membrane protein [Beggiatoa sp. PS]